MVKKKEIIKIYDTIIIGAGIAGCTAAIYAARERMNFLLLTDNFGGQFLESGEVLNYPGIKRTTGADFAQLMADQLEFNGVKPTTGIRVKKILRKKDYFLLQTNKIDYFTKTIIIATGAKARELNVPGERKYQHKGLTYCAICDGPLFKDKTVAVIGGGDSALDAANFLLNIAKKIYLVNLTSQFKAHEYLQESIRNNPQVEIISNAKTKAILGDKFVTGLKYEQEGKIQNLAVDGIFVEIGRVPNTEFVQNFLQLDEHNHIIADCQTNTSVPGIFAVGDCSSVHEYQYVIAAGMGCTALLKVVRYLARRK